MSTIAEARELARLHLAGPYPRRWRHVQGVASRAEEVAALLYIGPDVLVAAAWLHDIGYGPTLTDTGFHPIDGGRYLRAQGVGERIVCLVAHHTEARTEARLRGLDDVLAREFPREDSVMADALWYCDLTVGPDGTSISGTERLAEIESRYGPGHVVTRFAASARDELLAAVGRIEQQLQRSTAGV